MARPVLIKTINSMVLISIHPFAVRKIFLLAVALLGLSSAVCFADPLFMTRQYAPSPDQKGSAQTASAPNLNRTELSLLWRSFGSSGWHCAGLTPLVPLVEPSRGITDVAFTEAPGCWASPIASLLADPTLESTLAGNF